MAIIGIDLGTTNSLVTVWENGVAKILPNKLGSELTPSVVSIENGAVLVGQPAKDRLITHPDVTVGSFKRYMGTNKVFKLGEREFVPEELSALVIAKLKADAELYLGEKVEEAIISVPAYFNNDQRYATKVAAKLAGVTCNRIVNEPSAAALSCRMGKFDEDQTVLVVDFGGGTLDISIVDCFENIVEITAISGDNHLGGIDFDILIVEEFCKENQLEWEQLELAEREQLLKKAERCKIGLSQSDVAKMSFKYKDKEYSYALTKERLLDICSPLFVKMKQVISRALKDSELSIEDITDVLPVGGSCNMPIVREYLSYLFKRPIDQQKDADKMVANGLGVYCGIKMRKEEIKDVMLTDVCPFSLGTNVSNPLDSSRPIMSVIIERNTVLPIKTTRTYTVSTGAKSIYFKIYQGEEYYVGENIKIGEIYLDGLEGTEVNPIVSLTFAYDINGILDVTAKDISTGKEKNVVIVSDQNPLTAKEIQELKKRMDQLSFVDTEENSAVINMASRIYAESVGMLRDQAENLLYSFQSVLNTNSPIKIKKTREYYMQILKSMEEYMDRDVFEEGGEVCL